MHYEDKIAQKHIWQNATDFKKHFAEMFADDYYIQSYPRPTMSIKTFKKIIVHYDRNAYHNFHILFIILRCHVYHECFLKYFNQSYI